MAHTMMKHKPNNNHQVHTTTLLSRGIRKNRIHLISTLIITKRKKLPSLNSTLVAKLNSLQTSTWVFSQPSVLSLPSLSTIGFGPCLSLGLTFVAKAVTHHMLWLMFLISSSFFSSSHSFLFLPSIGLLFTFDLFLALDSSLTSSQYSSTLVYLFPCV